MTYIVIEIQTSGGTTAIVPPIPYADRLQAEAKYHQILAAAAVSSVEEHTAVLLTQDGQLVRRECYRHGETEPAADA